MGILNNKVILITRATEFVGQAICTSCNNEGATVIAQDPKFSDNNILSGFIANQPHIQTTPETDPHTLIARIISDHGRIDGLVPNDGYPAIRAGVENADMKDMRAGLENMVIEPFELIGAATPHMKKHGSGRIVIPTSAAPYHGIPNYSMYCIGRGAQHSMIQALSKELAKNNISINGVGGNYIESPSYFSEEVLKNEDTKAKITSQIPLGRMGKPEEMADVVTFLLSDKAGFITGHTVPVAGGWA